MISIIMAAYNAEQTIGCAIDSVLAQTYENFELLVINDGSTDQTAEIVKGYQDKRIRLINHEQNQGVSHARKSGLEKAKGDWIAILDSDDAWMPDKLEKQVQLQKEKNAEIIFTGSGFMDYAGNPVKWSLHVPPEINYKQLLKQNLLSNSSVLVRKKLYQENYFANDKMHEDFTIWLRILKSGKIAYGIDEPLLIYRLSASSKSGNKLKSAKMNWRTYRALRLNMAQSLYYEMFYAINGLQKYAAINRVLRGGGGNSQ